MKTLILTGATGFTGKYLVEEALKRNYHIIALVRKSSNIGFLLQNNVSVLIVDFSRKASLIRIFNEIKKDCNSPTLFIHNAGITKSLKRTDYEEGNANNTKNIIDALVEAELIPKKFIYTSSLAALGPGDAKSLAPIAEDATPKPVTYYGESKHIAEEYITKTSDLPWIIMRPTAVYGPGDGDTLNLFKSVGMGIEISLTKDDQYLSFIFVKDMATAYFEVAEKSHIHEIYNLSDGGFYTQKQLNGFIKSAMNKKTIKLRINPFFIKIAALGSEFKSAILGKTSILTLNKVNELKAINWKTDARKIQEEIGFQAETDLESGIRFTYKWYKKHGWI